MGGRLRYCLLTAAQECNIKIHPIEQMELLGYEVVNSTPIPVGDCWIFDVISVIEPLPPYLQKIDNMMEDRVRHHIVYFDNDIGLSLEDN